jgi:asparaginyl-tRNA synthetase
MVDTKPDYKSPHVEERFYAKAVPKHGIGEILRIEHIVKNAEKYYDTVGVVAGWARTLRNAGGNTIIFIELNDGSAMDSLQVVVNQGLPNFEEVSKNTAGASFRIKGRFIKSPAQGQLIEVQVDDAENHYVKVVGPVLESKTYPMAKKGHTLEYLREIAHLRPRSKYISSMIRVRNSLAQATHIFFQSKGFLNIHTPIVTASDCEGAGEMFQVTTVLPEHNESIKKVKTVHNKETIDYTKDFFKRPAFLTVSGQLSLENYACSMCNVYNFNPAFRAENSHTGRHLSEFWMIEPEIVFADIHDDMDLAEAYVKFCVQYALENHKDELEYFETEQFRRAQEAIKAQEAKKAQEEKKSQKDKKVAPGPAEEKITLPEVKLTENLRAIMNAEFRRMTYDEAIEVCIQHDKEGKVNFINKLEWGVDMSSEHERYLVEKVYKQPVIVYNHPKSFKAFYMRLNDDNKTVASMDVLVPGVGELIGGSQREERLEVLDARLEEMKLDKEVYWWYRDLRKFGTVPHAGFGLGFERLVMFVTGIDNIRDTIPFPRWPGHAEF